MQQTILQQICEAADFTTRSYTGRGMNKPCLGVILDPEMTSGQFFAALLDQIPDGENLSEYSDDFRKMKMDSLGHNTIVYFPSISFIDRNDDNEDENVAVSPSSVKAILDDYENDL